MSRLHVYTVHINPALRHPYEEAQFVEEGFNWKAFCFTGLWALYNHLWLFTLLIIAVNILLVLVSQVGISLLGMFCLFFCWHLIIGYSGNDILRKKLKKDGFITADIVTGDSLLRAEQRFFDRYFPVNNAAFAA